MTIVTLDELSRAIANGLDIEWDVAQKYASVVMDFFGFEDRIIDNILEQEERRLFYQLQELGILTAEREWTTLYNGNSWRTHYWRLEKNVISRFSNGKTPLRKNGSQKLGMGLSSYEDIYSNVTKDMWTSRKVFQA